MNDKILKITTVQTHLTWESVDTNLTRFNEKIKSIQQETDIITLPEMFTTGFSMNSSKHADEMHGKTLAHMREWAKERDCLVMGSAMLKHEGKFFNRLLAVYPEGNFEIYDKAHLFMIENEPPNYTRGNKKLVIQFRGWRIRPLVCYDLRFPVWCRNRNDYDLLVFVANWPGSRSHIWKTLLMARAIENQCYVVGTNRIGSDGMDIDYTGDSLFVDPKGNIILDMKEKDTASTVSLSLNDLLNFREKFPVLNDADNFTIHR
jgi:predicted amidohydrolase